MNKTTFLALLFIISFGVNAQRVVVKRPEGNEATPTKRSSVKDFSIGTDVGAYAIGYFPINVEYRLKDWVTVEGNIGLVTKNYVKSSFMFDDFGSIYRGDAKTGLGFGLVTKFFYADEAFDDGYYLGLSFRRLGYESSFSDSYYDGLTGEAVTTIGERTLSFMEFGLVWGKEWMPEDYFMLDSYYGFGLVNQKQYVSSNNTEYDLQNDGKNAREIPLSFILGLKICFLP